MKNSTRPEDKNDANQFLSRREWFGKLAMPAAGAAIAAGFIGTKNLSAAPAKSAASENDLGAHVYNIRSFGAKGDTTTLDTAAVQAAVDACAKDGGGTVLVPAGIFTIGAVELKSNVTLHIAAGGKLLGSGDGKQYHAVDAVPLTGDSTLNDGNWALLFAVNATNITVEGAGTIDGNGAQFVSPARGVPPPSGLGGLKRPYHILLYRCDRVILKDIALVDCAYHSLRIVQCKHLHADNLYIHNRLVGNGDGFHFISAEHVSISNCAVYSGDDACAMFGSCKFFTITNSVFSTRWSVFRFGGGKVSDIAVSNCILRQVYGCPIKFQGNPGAGFENMSFSNILLDDVTGPIHISIGPREPGRPVNPGLTPDQPAAELAPPYARNISFTNIHGTVTTDPGPLEGMPVSKSPRHYQDGERFNCITLNAAGDAVMQNISFDNINLTFGGGGTAEIAARRDLPNIAAEYFMLGAMPAYGFYARNAHGLTMQNVRLQVSTPDLRPALILDHVEDASISGISVQSNAAAESALRIISSSDVLITAPRLLTATTTFLQAEGGSNSNIIVDGGDLSKATTAVSAKNGASQNSIKLRNVT